MADSSKVIQKPEIQMALLKVMKSLTTLPAQVVFYGSIILAIAATGGAQLPGVLSMLSTTIGMNLLSNMLERVVRGENVPDEEIRKVVQETIQTTGIENLLTSNEFQRVSAHVFRQFDLLKYAVQRGEINIAALLSEQFAEHKIMLEEMQIELTVISEKLDTLATREQGERIITLIQQLDDVQGNDAQFQNANNMLSEIIRALSDEAKDGPRLFSIVPVEQSKLNPKGWISARFRLTLWCEHACLPLPVLNKIGDTRGVYDFDFPHEWFMATAPYLKYLTSTLRLIFPVAASIIDVSDDAYKSIQSQLDFERNFVETMLEGDSSTNNLSESDGILSLPRIRAIRAEGSLLRQFHALLKEKDPTFGGLVRVMNKRKEFLWVHERFACEY